MSDGPHSQEQFGPSRDHWWHDDYLDLLARRLDLHACRRILEVGAGVGHWTAHIVKRCAMDATITVVDREPAWIAALESRFAAHPRFTTIQANVTALPPLPGPFDLVTCQTLLLHLPLASVAKLLRDANDMLLPGGLLLLVEPNNLANRMGMSSVTCELTPAQYGELAAFWWAFEKGRVAQGLGEEWIAELLPKMIVDAGFERLAVYQNERAWPLYPLPAGDGGSEPLVQQETAAEQSKDAIRRNVLAGGLSEQAFERGWALVDLLDRRTAEAAADGSLSYSGKDNLLIFAARKAAAP